MKLTATDYKRGEQNGITASTLYSRINKYGFDYERAMTQKLKDDDRAYFLKIAHENGIKTRTFDFRVYELFWDKEDAATKEVEKKHSSK